MRSIAARLAWCALVSAAPSLAGCGAGGDADSGTDAGWNPGGCDQLWTVQDTQYGARAVRLTVEGGDLVIRALQPVTSPLTAITQHGIAGDFDAELAFRDFDSHGPGNYLRLQVDADGADPLRLDGVRHSVVIGSEFFNQTTNVTLRVGDERSDTAGGAGTFRISRRGAVLTLTGEVGTARLSQQVSFADQPAQLSIGVGLDGGMAWADQRLSVRVSDFRLRGGGATASSDGFDCDRMVRLPAP